MSNKSLFNLLLILGILYRFYFHFLVPSFNVDEISVGLNIKELSFSELLKPMPRGQSAPPLFLVLNKLIISYSPLPLWINFKLLSFVSSLISMILFRVWISKKSDNFIFIIPLLFFYFNPFVIYNSLTLKQYSFDVLGVLVLLVWHNHARSQRLIPLLFLIWPLLSNAALFSFVAYVIFLYYTLFKKIELTNIVTFVQKNSLLLFSPIVYVLYFFWFRKQDGFEELRNYMMQYWSGNFLTFDESFFNYLARLIHQIWLIFYSQIDIVGFLVFGFTIVTLLYNKIVKKNIFLKSELKLLFLIYFIHLLFNVFKLYPLSDRLMSYNVILFLLLLTSAIHFYYNFDRYRKVIIGIFIFIPILTFFFNFNYRENDIVALKKKLKQNHEKNVIITKVVHKTIFDFNKFTDNYFECNENYKVIDNINFKLKQNDLIVSRVHRKIKVNKTSNGEELINQLIKLKRLELLDEVNGYSIYKVN